MIELGGLWRAAAADESLRRNFHKIEHDDTMWCNARVPGHWAEVPELADAESVLYRKAFTNTQIGDSEPTITQVGTPTSTREQSTTATTQTTAATQHDAQRWWLRFEGLAQQGYIWLDGTYLGNTEGYFVPHEMEVTQQIKSQTDHVLAVEAICKRFSNANGRTSLTGALQDPELLALQCPRKGTEQAGKLNAKPSQQVGEINWLNETIIGGLWRRVWIRSSGVVAIRGARAICTDVRMSSSRAKLALRVVIDTPEATPVHLRTRLERTHTTASSERSERTATHRTHTQRAHTHSERTHTEQTHTHSAAAGANHVEWTIEVFDPELWWPHALGDQPLYTLTIDAIVGSEIHDSRCFRVGFRKLSMKRWILTVNGERIHLKGVNLLPKRTLLGTASHDEIVEDIHAAKAAHLDIVRPVAHITHPEFYEAADKAGMLIWQDMPIRGRMNRAVGGEARRQAREAINLLGHHPSLAIWCAHDTPFTTTQKSLTTTIAQQQNPSWNRDVLDRWLCRIFKRIDGSRPVVPHTSTGPRLSGLSGTTAWYGDKASDLAKIVARVPRLGGFISDFKHATNTQVPSQIHVQMHTHTAPANAHHHTEATTANTHHNTHTTTENPHHTKQTIETLRRLKYWPNGGFLCPYNLPWRTVADACRPLTVIADILPRKLSVGYKLKLPIHVVNDTRVPVNNATVHAQITMCAQTLERRSWTGSVKADACEFVGYINTVIPDVTTPTNTPTPDVNTPIVTPILGVNTPKHDTHTEHTSLHTERKLLRLELKLEVEGEIIAVNYSEATVHTDTLTEQHKQQQDRQRN